MPFDPAREVSGIVAPYRVVTHMYGDIGGRMFMPGLFTRSLAEPRSVKLLAIVGGKDARPVGWLSGSEERTEGLFCRFAIMAGPVGDKVLAEVEGGWWPQFEPAYLVMHQGRGDSGSIEVTEARLCDVQLVAVGVFEQCRAATGLAARHAAVLAPFRNRPKVDLSPLPAIR